MSKIDMLIKAFNLNPNNAIWDESKKQLELEKFISHKTALAGVFFAQKSSETKKMRRDKQDKQDCSVIKITNNGVTELYLMSGKGQELGAGSFGRAKLAIRISPPDPDLNLYVIKREWTNTPRQQEETIVLQNLKVMVGDKMQRSSTTKKRQQQAANNAGYKFYTVMSYLGEDLLGIMRRKQLNVVEKLDVGTQVALRVHHLHADSHYAHLDLKQANIVLDTSIPGVYKVHLIDFGLSKRLDSQMVPRFGGTYGYLPGTSSKQEQMDDIVRRTIVADYNYASLDVFALKRTLTQENINQNMALVDITSLQTVNIVLYEMLSTKDDLASLKRRDTVAMIAANLILHELQIYPLCVLSDENSKKIIDIYEKNKNISKEELEKELEILYPAGVYEAATRCKDLLGLEHGQVVFDAVFVKNILSLKGDKDEISKIKQLLFFRKYLYINLPLEKLQSSQNLFPPRYPFLPLTLQEILEMLSMLDDSKDSPWKSKISVLERYFNIDIGQKIIDSQQKCENFLRLLNLAKNENLHKQRKIIDHYLKLSEIDCLFNINIDFVHLNIEEGFASESFFRQCSVFVRDLELKKPCYSKSALLEYKDTIKRIILLQIMHLSIFNAYLDSTSLENVSLKKLDSILEIYNQLIRETNSASESSVQLKNKLREQMEVICKYRSLFKLTQKYRITMDFDTITDQNLEAIQAQLNSLKKLHGPDDQSDHIIIKPENKEQHDVLVFKTVLASLELDNMFPDLSGKMSSDLSLVYTRFFYNDGGMHPTYDSLRNHVAAQTIRAIINKSYPNFKEILINDGFNETCVFICNYYRKLPQENRLEFQEVFNTALEAFRKYNPDEKDSSKLIDTLTKVLDDKLSKCIQDRLKDNIESMRSSEYPIPPTMKPQ